MPLSCQILSLTHPGKLLWQRDCHPCLGKNYGKSNSIWYNFSCNRGLRVGVVMRVAGVTSERGASDECVCEQARAARACGALSVVAANATSQRRSVLQQRHTQHRTPSSCDTRCLPPLKRSTSTCFHVEVLLT